MYMYSLRIPAYRKPRGKARSNPHSENPQTENPRVGDSGRFPADLGLPPLVDQNMLESKPLKS